MSCSLVFTQFSSSSSVTVTVTVTVPPLMESSSFLFDRERHVRYLEMMYSYLPSDYEREDINRITLAYFAISGLHILDALDRVDKEQVANWVMSFQVHPKDTDDLENGEFYGFCGSRTAQIRDGTDLSRNGSHLANTYCALSILKIVGYNFSSVSSESILISMRKLQQPDGSYMPIHAGAEKDLRFVFCAAAICSMLDNWKGIDREKAKKYILSCQSYDGGFGLVPCSESHGSGNFLVPYQLNWLVDAYSWKIQRAEILTIHARLSGSGGATYCAVAALRLMGFIEENLMSRSTLSSIINVPLLLEWCLQRQAPDGGFQGRTNKISDTCYAFWVGGVLRMLGAQNFFNKGCLREFLFTCQSKYGGFGKFPENLPDLYHSYYGISAFSLLEEPGVKPLLIELGIVDIAAANR
ncbi:hypothetical protein GIB67_040468 [Kingdonia uniflora]|uniref:Geranylgeranyl transferase type-1 subunit beta n=1 Tax=Kingdonia uniflora TaxID=39325 RepID=A0A7J7L584_9MAGN|nr:hypothetical protein GIB67_040468 [Kingdonia uniflora]